MKKRWDIRTCSKLRKVSNRKNQCEDRISLLPDDILYFIQSLLKCEEVARMSTLSRRWLNLWKNALVLQFGAPILLDQHLRAPIVPEGRNQTLDCDKLVSTIISRLSDVSGETPERERELLERWIRDVKNQKHECDKSTLWMTCHTPDERNQKGECDKMVNWMSRVSQMHKGQDSNELRVSYTLYKCYKKKDIDSWWEDTLAEEFQSLELDFLSIDCQDSSYVFPDRLLGFCSDCLLWTLSFDSHFLESSSGFKSLKSLSLKGILITNNSIDFVLVNCPSLERLEVVDSPILVSLKIDNTKSLALKYLKIEDCEKLGILNVMKCNIVSLKLTATPILTLRKLSRLIDLSIDGTPCDCNRDFLCHPELKTLTLSPFKPKDIVKKFKITCQLTKLERLVVNVDASGDKSLTGLIALINACPVLKEFVLMLNWYKPLRSNMIDTEKHEKCRLEHLKVVEFLGYYGRVSDVELTVHLMENADNLEKVIIDPWNPQHVEHCYEEEAEARLLAFKQLKRYVLPLVQFIIR